MDRDRTIARLHKVRVLKISEWAIEDVGLSKVYNLEEYYEETEIETWKEDEKGNRLIHCRTYSCSTMLLVKNQPELVERSHSTVNKCRPCITRTLRSEFRDECDVNYREKFDSRIKRFVAACRKVDSDLFYGARKARLTKSYDIPKLLIKLKGTLLRKEIVREINDLAIAFNLKVKSYRLYDTTYDSGTTRARISFKDINPMIELFEELE